MADQIHVDIVTNGKSINPFSHLSIIQQFNGHHRFEIRFNHDVIEKSDSLIIADSQDFLGKLVTITLKDKQRPGLPDNIFKGLITEIGFANTVGAPNGLIFKGYSPTILLEAGKTSTTFTSKNLAQIVRDVLSDIPGNLLSSNIQPVYKSSIPYTVQYEETGFEFLRRIAGEYGEWFFYDGSSFCFGKPASAQTFELQFPQDIIDMNIDMQVAPLKFEQIDYFSKNNEKFVSNSSSLNVAGLDKFGEHAQKTSNELFSKIAFRYSEKKSANKGELDSVLKFEKSSRVANLVLLKGVSDAQHLRLGSVMSVKASTQVEKDRYKEENYGKFVVLELAHSVDGTGNYQNSFESVPATIEVLPNPFDTPPHIDAQLGIVKQNNDPDNLGRVKVQLLWQKDKETTPWIKVMSPHAGTSSDNKKNRGIFFTPEVDDYVMVGFNNGNPERPFVLGSVHHGKSIDSSKNADNHIKAIRTRSGSTIYFKDKENSGEQEIIVKTDDSNTVSILVKNGEGTITIKSSKDIVVTSDKTVKIKSEKISIEASDKIELKAQQITIEASQKLDAKGVQVNIEGSATTKIKGAQLDLEGSGIANLKAALVKIN